MIIFFDTSALVKRYIKEPGYEDIDHLFLKAKKIIISRISLTELVSTLARLKRENSINQHIYNQTKRYILDDARDFEVMEINSRVTERSHLLVESHPLKSLDALQLACALSSSAKFFASSDKQQIFAAKKEKLKTIFI